MAKQGYCFSHTPVVIRNCNKLFYKYIDSIGDVQPVDVHQHQVNLKVQGKGVNHNQPISSLGH